MKKKITRECFQVEPMEGQLDPGQERTVNISFSANKEIKLKTVNNTTDLVCEILEGNKYMKALIVFYDNYLKFTKYNLF
jgi:hydrocephalus-inducing protein